MGSCGITVMLDLSLCSDRNEMSIPSIIICPEVDSKMRNNESANEDFPLNK